MDGRKRCVLLQGLYAVLANDVFSKYTSSHVLIIIRKHQSLFTVELYSQIALVKFLMTLILFHPKCLFIALHFAMKIPMNNPYNHIIHNTPHNYLIIRFQNYSCVKSKFMQQKFLIRAA